MKFCLGRKFIALLLAVIFELTVLPIQPTQAEEKKPEYLIRLPGIEGDKYAHLFTCAALTLAVRERGLGRGDSLALVGSLGLAKELFDQLLAGKDLDPVDLVFDLLGAGLVLVFK